jgi:hypothetical protein
VRPRSDGYHFEKTRPASIRRFRRGEEALKRGLACSPTSCEGYDEGCSGEDFRPYRILGACNPQLAHRALKLEDKIGTMLPCNVIVQQHADGAVEVSAVDPVASMQAIKNPALAEVANEVQAKLKRVVEGL